MAHFSFLVYVAAAYYIWYSKFVHKWSHVRMGEVA